MNYAILGLITVISFLTCIWVFQKFTFWFHKRDVQIYLEELDHVLVALEQRYSSIVDISANYIHSLSSEARTKLHELFCVIGDMRARHHDWSLKLRHCKYRPQVDVIRNEMDTEFGEACTTALVDPLSAFSMIVNKRIEDIAHEISSLSLNNNLRQQPGVTPPPRRRKATVELLRSEGFLKDFGRW